MPLEPENEEIFERQITPQEFLEFQKKAIRRKSFLGIALGLFAIAASTTAVWLVINYFPEYIQDTDLAGKSLLRLLFQNIFFLLGAFFLFAGIYGLYQSKNLSLDDLIPSPEAIEFLRQGYNIRPLYTYVFIGCLITVTLVQLIVENASMADFGNQSGNIAGLVKPLVWDGEWWRILTAATLHGIFPFHLYFNAQAFYGFGSMIETLSNRAHLAIVFLLSVIGGSLFSLLLMPEVNSIGASGGIMGLIGYLAIYGYRRQRQLPSDFLRTMLINIGFIAAFGLVAYQVVDNFGHLGGLVTGAIYGFLQIPGDYGKNPREVKSTFDFFGLAALGTFLAVSVFTILLLFKIV